MMAGETNHREALALVATNMAEWGWATTSPIDEHTFSVVTRLDTVGNVLRRGCIALGTEACKGVCGFASVLAPGADGSAETAVGEGDEALTPAEALNDDPLLCADNNLRRGFEYLEVEPERALIVSVGAPKQEQDRIGFLDDPEVASQLKKNPYGWFEIGPNPPFNAFFAYDDTELQAGAGPLQFLGARLADSGFVVMKLKDYEGRSVTGIVHVTRTNMRGTVDTLREYDGVKQTFVSYVVDAAMKRYQARPEDVTLSLVGAVGPESWRKQFPGKAKLDEVLPGWAEAGLVTNKSNSAWTAGEEVARVVDGNTEMDVLWPHYPELIKRDLRIAALVKGIPPENLQLDNVLDPGKPPEGGLHSSDDAQQRGELVIAASVMRDLYGARIMHDDELDRIFVP